jgi:hypothetical protein
MGSFSYWKSRQWGTYLSARQDGSVNLQPRMEAWERWISDTNIKENYKIIKSEVASLNSFHKNWLCGTP